MWKLALALLLCTTLIACQKTPTSQTTPPQKITFAYTWQPQSTLVHIAMAKGYFVEEGLEVQPLMQTYGKMALQSVLENKADFATVAETPVMFSILNGEKIFVIANIEASSVNNAIVARKDAGINKPSDLKGKRIGFTPGTTSDFFLDSLLTAQGMTRQDIVAIGIKPEEMLAAITAQKLDAVSTWNYPLTLIQRQLGSNSVVFYDREIYTETFNIAARQSFIQKNPETAKKLLRALIKAEDFVTQHPDEAQNIMSAASKVDKQLVREVWNAFHYHVVLDQTLVITLEDETRWAIKNKLSNNQKMPNYADYIYSDTLKAIKPEAVKGTL